MPKYSLNLRTTTHEFQKQNSVTQKGGYDILICKHCGLGARRYGVSETLVVKSGKPLSESVLQFCPKAIDPRIKVQYVRVLIKPRIINAGFDNLQVGQIMKCVPCPPGERNRLPGVWVMGVHEPVKLLSGEFEPWEAVD